MGEVIPYHREPHQGSTPSTPGGGGPTSEDMEARVKALEDRAERIDRKLDGIATDMAYIKGKIEGMPSAAAFGELKGRVDSLPTMSKAATMLGIAVAAITIINNWDKVSAFFSATP